MRTVLNPPPLTIGVDPNTGEQILYPTPFPGKQPGSSGISASKAKEIARKVVKKNACCPPTLGGWGQLILNSVPQFFPDPGLNRLMVQLTTGLASLFTVKLEILHMDNPATTAASVVLVPSEFPPNSAILPVLSNAALTPGVNFDILSFDLDTTDVAEASNADIIITNKCGCSTVLPLQIIEPQ